LIVGRTGVWLPPPTCARRCGRVSVVLDAMQTGPAIRTYNIMMASGGVSRRPDRVP